MGYAILYVLFAVFEHDAHSILGVEVCGEVFG